MQTELMAPSAIIFIHDLPIIRDNFGGSFSHGVSCQEESQENDVAGRYHVTRGRSCHWLEMFVS